LLSAPSRERIHATATFTLIFLFAVTSVDFIVAGGAEFGSLRSPESRSLLEASQHSAPERSALEASAAPADQSMPTAVAPALADVTEANVLPVSQSFEATPIDSTDFAPASLQAAEQLLTPIAASLMETSEPSETSLIGEPTGPTAVAVAPSEPGRPRKAPADSFGPRAKTQSPAASSQ
jgi:hypothetical protein